MFGTTTATAAPKTDTATNDDALIKDATEATFMKDVIEASQLVPVIVDFWAPWCGPCKTLGPALEAAVTAAKGRVRMVKMDVDKNQQIATELRIQSIPTVYAFYKGQPVDGFQGALSASDLKKFVETVADKAGPPDNGLADAIDAAEAMLTEGAFDDARETFAAILEEEPENVLAYSGLIRTHIAMGLLVEAQALIDAAPAAIANSKEITSAKAQLDLAHQAANAGPETDLRNALSKDPTDRQTMFDLAAALLAADKTDEAVTLLLDLFKLDRDWNDGAAKAQLFKVFDALKPQDPIVLAGRRRLSSIIFS